MITPQTLNIRVLGHEVTVYYHTHVFQGKGLCQFCHTETDCGTSIEVVSVCENGVEVEKDSVLFVAATKNAKTKLRDGRMLCGQEACEKKDLEERLVTT